MKNNGDSEGGLLVYRYPPCFLDTHTHTCTGQDTPQPHTPDQYLASPRQGQTAAHVTTAATAAADGTARSPRGAAKQIRRCVVLVFVYPVFWPPYDIPLT